MFVTVPPSQPSTPVVEFADETRVDLSWKPPRDDGGAPILNYLIESKEKYVVH